MIWLPRVVIWKFAGLLPESITATLSRRASHTHPFFCKSSNDSARFVARDARDARTLSALNFAFATMAPPQSDAAGKTKEHAPTKSISVTYTDVHGNPFLTVSTVPPIKRPGSLSRL